MNLPEIGTIIIATCGALILGMAGLIKVMILSRLDKIQDSMDQHSSELHVHDVRITKLETEHSLRTCMLREETHA